MDRMLFIVDNLAAGGAGRAISRLANEFSHKNYEVYITSLSNNVIGYPLEDNVKYCLLYKGEKIPAKKKIELITKLCKEKLIDYLISFISEINIYCIIASIGQSWQVIVSERCDPKIAPTDKRIRFLRKLLYRFADGIVFQTEEAKGYFTKSIQEKSKVILNPLDISDSSIYKGKRRKTIVSVGRLDEQKNFPMLINAYHRISKKYNDYTVEIYGDGKLKDTLRKMIYDLGLEGKIILKGHDSELLKHICDASVFVLCSDYEGLSNALIEAMAIGLPVISTDHAGGGAREVITDGYNGLLIRVGDIRELSEKMDYLLSNPDIAAHLGKNATLVRDRCSSQRICEEWENYIKFKI